MDPEDTREPDDDGILRTIEDRTRYRLVQYNNLRYCLRFRRRNVLVRYVCGRVAMHNRIDTELSEILTPALLTALKAQVT